MADLCGARRRHLISAPTLPIVSLGVNRISTFIQGAIVLLIVTALTNLLSWVVFYEHVIKPIVDRGFHLKNPIDIGLYFSI